ncbi:hypothetical protein MHLP_04560 [Candidatus Mycoplasma haematolamae str. Purdue]|uniref:Uncharacterized protein n=1 Tax=Mycoplasma haematolamae (strain Purdue) TaxID=1212765 RepID=I7C7H6_MYCHA|nr:hypothetical protein [Candidatus Mycoplasma haematolamae]AFO52492.1 hypothetical protein MHLP_04560 [Candidatus Mycoplasma haematolamae str. Purdue]
MSSPTFEEINSFGEELMNLWRSKSDDEQQYDKFITYAKEELQLLIDYFIKEIEDIKAVNKLIRLKESLNTIFDLKLLWNNLKLIVGSAY